MLSDNEHTPPINTFGAQRALARELANIRNSVRRLTSLVVIELVLLGLVFAVLLGR